MKSFNISGNILITEAGGDVMKDFLDLFTKGPADFLGSVISCFTPQKQEPKLSEYEKARQDMIKQFKEQRETEIKNDAKHRDSIKALNYKIEQTAELNKKKALEAEREQKRNAEKVVLQKKLEELKKMGDRAKALAGANLGPASEEAYKTIQQRCAQIAKEVPAEATMAEDVMANLALMCTDENGKFTADKDAWEANLKKAYGEDYMNKEPFNSPQWREKRESFRKDIDNKSDEWAGLTESQRNDAKTNAVKNALKQAAKGELGVRDEQAVKDDMKILSDVKTAVEKHNKDIADNQNTLTDLGKNLDEKRKQLEDIDNKLKTNAKLISIGTSMNGESSDEKKVNIIIDDMFKDDDINGLFVNVDKDGKVTDNPADGGSKKINPKSPLYKQLKKAGWTDENIDELSLASTGTNELKNAIKDKINGDDDMRKSLIKDVESKVESAKSEEESLKNQQTELNNAIKTLNTDIGATQDSLNTLKNKTFDNIVNELNPSQTPDAVRKVIGDKYTTGIPDPETIDQAISKCNRELNQERELDDMMTKAQEKAQRFRNETKTQEAINKAMEENPELRKQIDQLKPNHPKYTKPEDGKPGKITYYDDHGKEVTLTQPDPNTASKEEIEKFDNAVRSMDALIDPGTEPTLGDPPTKQQIIDHKQWEINKQARDYARGNMDDDDIKSLEELNDPEKQKDIESNNYDDELDDEVKNDEARIKELNDKKAKGDELTAEEQQELNKLNDKYGEDDEGDPKDPQDKTNQDNGTDNTKKPKHPGKTWRRRKNKNTGKPTERYYYAGENNKRKGESISKKEYLQKMKAYNDATNEGAPSVKPILFRKSTWTMSGIGKSTPIQ